MTDAFYAFGSAALGTVLASRTMCWLSRIAGAALDAGVEARIEGWLHASADHPVALNFPEGEYLKGLICRV